jgi:hypothetical protein
MEAAMHQSANFLGTEPTDYQAWRNLIRPLSGRINVEGVEPGAQDLAGNGAVRRDTDKSAPLAHDAEPTAI